MNIKDEERKIKIAHRLLHHKLRRSHFSYDDGGYHNLRAMLINRVEQESNGVLIVKLDGGDPKSIPKIVNRQEYLNRIGR